VFFSEFPDIDSFSIRSQLDAMRHTLAQHKTIQSMHYSFMKQMKISIKSVEYYQFVPGLVIGIFEHWCVGVVSFSRLSHEDAGN